MLKEYIFCKLFNVAFRLFIYFCQKNYIEFMLLEVFIYCRICHSSKKLKFTSDLTLLHKKFLLNKINFVLMIESTNVKLKTLLPLILLSLVSLQLRHRIKISLKNTKLF